MAAAALPAVSPAAVATLQLRSCWGAAPRCGLRYLDEGALLYSAGSNLVLISPDGGTQRFLGCQAQPSALAACPNSHLLAVAEPGDRATIAIYDGATLKRRKLLTAAEGTKEIVSLAFSKDGRYLAAQGGAPDWALSLWVWQKSKLVASIRTVSAPGHAVAECLFQPVEEPKFISVVGEGTCGVYAIEAGNTLRAVPTALSKRDTQPFTCHAWLLDGGAAGAGGAGLPALVVGTRRGEALVLVDGEVRQVLTLEGGARVEAVAAHSKGFVAGTSHGTVAAFERDSDSKPYRLAKSFAVDAPHSSAGGAAAGLAPGEASAALEGSPVVAVCSLAVSPADESIALLTSDCRLLQLAVPPGGRRALFSGLQPLGPGFHAGEITGLATCVRRPVVATCGADRTLRLWNWQDGRAELVKSFGEVAHSLALHPGGYLLLAGFADKLRLMTVLSDDLQVVAELPIKAARELCFSNGGALFAAANGNTAHIYCAHTCASLAVLRGHNGKVRGLWWAADDATLVTAGADGAVYEWRVHEGRRSRDFVQNGWSYSAVSGMQPAGAAPSSAPTIFASATDRMLRTLEGGSGGLAVTTEVDAGTVLTQLVAPSAGGRLLFAATEEGSVRAYRLSLTPESPYTAVRCGPAPVTRLAATRDGAMLFAATADGCLFAFDIKDRDAARLGAGRREGEGLSLMDQVLVGRSDIHARQERMAELEAQARGWCGLAEATAQNEYQLKLRDMALAERVRELTDAAGTDAGAAAQRYNALLEERRALEQRYETALADAHEQAAVQLAAANTQFQKQLVHEMQRYDELATAKRALSAKWEAQAAELVAQHARVVDELQAGHASQLAAERARYGALAVAKDVGETEAVEVRRQMEEDVDREVEELKARYKKELAAAEDACMRLKGENGLLRKRHDEQQAAVEEGRGLLRSADAEKRQLAGVIEGLQRELDGLRRELAARDATLVDKERRIAELAGKTQELDTFKFVLEHSVAELRAQLAPRDAQLADARARLTELEGQVAEAGRGRAVAALELEGRKQREAALRREVAREREMQHDMALAVEQIQSPDLLKASVKRLYQTHAAQGAAATATQGAGGAGAPAAPGAGQEAEADGAVQRQVEALERTAAQLRAALEAEKRAAAATQRRMVAENAELIRELREARAGSGGGRRSATPSRVSGTASRAGAVSPSCGGVCGSDGTAGEQRVCAGGGGGSVRSPEHS